MNEGNIKIWFCKTNDPIGPFSLEVSLDGTKSGKFSLTDLAFCKKAGDSWLKWEVILQLLGYEPSDFRVGISPIAKIEKGIVDFSPNPKINSSQTEVKSRPSGVLSLDEMLSHSTEFRTLSNKIDSFNLWQFFAIRNSESHHEKVLKWIFDQKGTHSVGSAFLRNWLIDLLEKNQSKRNGERVDTHPLGPINLDYAVFKSVVETQLSIQVGDRSKRLDLFFEIETMRQGKWAIIVEMKVQNSISENQLSSYRKWLDERKEYAQHRKILILLYDDAVQSNHPENWIEQEERKFWMPTTFYSLRKTLQRTLLTYKTRISSRENSFIEQYLEILPPLSSQIISDQMEDLAYQVFGKYQLGIKYAFDAHHSADRNYWQEQVIRFMKNHASAFRLLFSFQDHQFLKREISRFLKKESWFPFQTPLQLLRKEEVKFNELTDQKWPKIVEAVGLFALEIFVGQRGGHECIKLRYQILSDNLREHLRGKTLSFDLEEGGVESIDLFDRSSKITKMLQSVLASDHFNETTNLISSYLGNDSGNTEV